MCLCHHLNRQSHNPFSSFHSSIPAYFYGEAVDQRWLFYPSTRSEYPSTVNVIILILTIITNLANFDNLVLAIFANFANLANLVLAIFTNFANLANLANMVLVISLIWLIHCFLITILNT